MMDLSQRPLASAIKVILGGGVFAASAVMAQTDVSHEDAMPIIHVTALAVDEDANKIVAPYSILDDQQISQRGSATLGELLNGFPGVHADTFGGGASRPVVRGQTSPRVKVLSDGTSLLDASDISPDHAVTADPLLAHKVEVLRGPATLLYGGGAIGGVVNVLDNKIPESLPEQPVEGFVALRGNTVASERAGAVSATARLGDQFALHVEGSTRDADDYQVSRWEEDHVPGTFSESHNASIGASWIGERGFFGLAYSYRDDEYGLPGHSHEYEGCHPHGSSLHCGGHDDHDDDHDHEHEHGHGDVPVIDLESKRIDLRGEYLEPFAGVHKIRIRASHTDYQHHEMEDDEIATTFRNKGYEGRIEIDHAPVLGWHGVVGAQFADTEFSALGAEAFIPDTESRTLGIFAVEHYELNDQWHLELGARYEQQEHTTLNDPRNRPAYDESATSFSAAIIWEFVPETTLALSFANAERLPQAQELYARGIHLATNTYECGLMPHPLTCGGLDNNAALAKEVSNNVELSLRKHSGALTYSVNAFRNEVDDYIYARTLDQYEDFRLIKYTQQDAEFTGVEGEVTWQFDETLAATLFGDYVRAEFVEGGNLPRIPASRVGGRLNMDADGMGLELEYYHVNAQDDIAAYETRTPSYNMLNATVSIDVLGNDRYQVFVRGNNLLNEKVWNHTSFLAAVVPQPGRNLIAGFKYTF